MMICRPLRPLRSLRRRGLEELDWLGERRGSFGGRGGEGLGECRRRPFLVGRLAGLQEPLRVRSSREALLFPRRKAAALS